ncbi:MAG: 16S rRNA (cytosine(967)-C(5))-methyltransferase RsmB [Verrucomicrobia bacterium]|nr:16S rRNA (cytosine(967)-C(5))-methyltransferase RsmB [Verrucomicrobiota bacterium]MCF7709072.1 16S rRNA (cytosine(967)-C(5))-methyltransferase RsmB [Verrucomicrobiota bacterium]
MSCLKPREITVRILLDAENERRRIDELLPKYLDNNRIAKEDRALVWEMAHGIGQWKSALDFLIDRKTRQPPRNSACRAILRLGLYQMFWLDRIPDHAAVNETVGLARNLGIGGFTGLVNGILRGYTREREQTRRLLEELKTVNPPIGYSHPAGLWKRWIRRWGETRVRWLMDWNNTPAPAFARINTLRTTADEVTHKWAGEGVQFEQQEFDWTPPDLVFRFDSYPSIQVLDSFKQGMFYIQDPSTLLSVNALDPQPGETILDFCAAPGGKTSYISQVMRNSGRVIAADTSPARLKRLDENLTRLGISNVRVHDQSAYALSEHTGAIDRVLVDVPCSNTGVLRRRIEARWNFEESRITRLAERQKEILEHASRFARKGGRLVYSTCSIEPEENEEVVRSFLEGHRDFKIVSDRTLLPFNEHVDGAYVAIMKRVD